MRHFEHDYHQFTAGFIKKNGHLKYQNATFQKDQQVATYVQKPWYYEIKLTSRYIPSFGIKRNGVSDLSKWLPAISPIVCTILNGMALLTMIGW